MVTAFVSCDPEQGSWNKPSSWWPVRTIRWLLQKSSVSTLVLCNENGLKKVLVPSKFKQNTPNTPSASKHCVDRGHAISGGLDLHEEIRLHQTGSGLEKKKTTNVLLLGCKSYSVMGQRTKIQPKFYTQNLMKQVKASRKRLWNEYSCQNVYFLRAHHF